MTYLQACLLLLHNGSKCLEETLDSEILSPSALTLKLGEVPGKDSTSSLDDEGLSKNSSLLTLRLEENLGNNSLTSTMRLEQNLGENFLALTQGILCEVTIFARLINDWVISEVLLETLAF